MICIIDYGSGNVRALMNLLRHARIPHFLSRDPNALREASRFILPGVGAFDPTISQLRASGMVAALEAEVMDKGKPVLGICIGMHLLAEGSDEGERCFPTWGGIRSRAATAVRCSLVWTKRAASISCTAIISMLPMPQM
jgi:imidazole glycerol-phosphate synthase subunit HisH